MVTATSGPIGVPEQVGHVHEGSGLLGDGLGHDRMGVPKRGHGQTGEEVEVALPVDVEQACALAPDEGDRGLCVVVHERAAVARRYGARRSGVARRVPHHGAHALVGEELEQ